MIGTLKYQKGKAITLSVDVIGKDNLAYFHLYMKHGQHVSDLGAGDNYTEPNPDRFAVPWREDGYTDCLLSMVFSVSREIGDSGKIKLDLMQDGNVTDSGEIDLKREKIVPGQVYREIITFTEE